MLLDRANRQKYSSARSKFKNLQAPSYSKEFLFQILISKTYLQEHNREFHQKWLIGMFRF